MAGILCRGTATNLGPGLAANPVFDCCFRKQEGGFASAPGAAPAVVAGSRQPKPKRIVGRPRDFQARSDGFASAVNKIWFGAASRDAEEWTLRSDVTRQDGFGPSAVGRLTSPETRPCPSWPPAGASSSYCRRPSSSSSPSASAGTASPAG